MAVNNPSVGPNIDEMGVVKVVSTTDNVDFSNTGQYTLYTVPTGYRFVTLSLVIRPTTVTSYSGNGDFTVSRSSDDSTIINFNLSTTFNSTNEYLIYTGNQFSSPTPIINGSDSVKFTINTPVSGTLVVSVDLIGYLIKL
jgi:hypothetical protein